MTEKSCQFLFPYLAISMIFQNQSQFLFPSEAESMDGVAGAFEQECEIAPRGKEKLVRLKF